MDYGYEGNVKNGIQFFCCYFHHNALAKTYFPTLLDLVLSTVVEMTEREREIKIKSKEKPCLKMKANIIFSKQATAHCQLLAFLWLKIV